MQGSTLRVFTLRQLLALFGQSRSLFLKGGETGLMQGVLDGLVPVPRGIDDRLVERGAEGLKSLAGSVFAASAELWAFCAAELAFKAPVFADWAAVFAASAADWAVWAAFLDVSAAPAYSAA